MNVKKWATAYIAMSEMRVETEKKIRKLTNSSDTVKHAIARGLEIELRFLINTLNEGCKAMNRNDRIYLNRAITEHSEAKHKKKQIKRLKRKQKAKQVSKQPNIVWAQFIKAILRRIEINKDKASQVNGSMLRQKYNRIIRDNQEHLDDLLKGFTNKEANKLLQQAEEMLKADKQRRQT